MGPLDSIYTKSYVYWLVNSSQDIQIDIVDFNPSQNIREKYVALGVDNYFSVEPSSSFLSKIPKVRVLDKLYSLKKLSKKLHFHYDICHLHFSSPSSLIYLQPLKRNFSHLVCSIWGSDFYKVNRRQRIFQKRLFQIADAITFGNPKTLDDFKKKFKTIPPEKLKLAYFGSPIIDTIKSIKDSEIELFRKKLEIPTESTIVTCGYSGSPAQQHIKLIESLNAIKEKLPNNIVFLFPLTYGGTKEYKKDVVKFLEKTGLEYRVYTGFMIDKEIATIRKISNIMIHVQTTDSFSSSMREHLYAANIVITGDWLPYDTLDERGVFMLKVSSVDEVGDKLLYAINNFDELKNKCRNNPRIIWELSSWEKNIHKWLEIYNEVLRGKNEWSER
ncbi:MAG: hypothetical protein PWQ70_3294 [Clostridiales bacterium]|nr:hypothetical protein [Clostridiales bacterium]